MDANLLILFKIIWEERSSTKASRRLHLTQSAVSQSLKKLRVLFNDDLFVRIPSGLAPTPRAVELSTKILSVADSIEALMRNEQTFDISQSTATFNMQSTDYFERLVLPGLVKTITKEAPQIRVRSTVLDGRLPKTQLQTGEVDCAVAGYFNEIPDGFFQKQLFEDQFTGLCRSSHPFLKSKQDIQSYCKYPHLMVSITGDFKGIIDSSLSSKSKRHICLTSTNFLSLQHALLDSDALFVIPSRLAKMHAKDFDLKVFQLPVKTSAIKIQMVWHERVHRDPFQKWMRSTIADIVK